MNPDTLPTEAILQHIKQNFYDPHSLQKRFYTDRRMLLYTITWPASWLSERGLSVTPQRYQDLLHQRLDAIAKHGNPKRYNPYFPRYLLKSIQDWFAWHGDDLYFELKHIRNSLSKIEDILQNMRTQNTEDIVTPMARAHAVLASQYQRKKLQPEPPNQLTLFS